MEKYCDHSIAEVCGSNREIIKKIFDHALQFREQAPVVYSPLTRNPLVNIVHDPGIDFAALFGEYKPGDYAYLSCCMDGLYEKDLIINVKGAVNFEVYFNGVRQALSPQPDGSFDADVTFMKGKNVLLVRVTAGEDGFSGYAKPLLPKLRMFPAGYVYYTRMYIETDGFYRQNGITVSRLYRSDEQLPCPDGACIDWVFPVKPIQTNQKSFRFHELCAGKGKAAYVYTHVQGELSIVHDSPMTVFCRGQELYSAACGKFTRSFEEAEPLLIKSCRRGERWGFSADVDGSTSMPQIEGALCPDLQWIWIGPFGRVTDADDLPYAPEYDLQLEEPYQSICAGPVYWKFYRPDTFLRQYANSAFFGQWFYAAMVGHYGMKLAAEKLRIPEFREYFMASIGQMCRHRNYSVYDKGLTGWASYMPNSASLHNLDSIGTIGINVAEYYLMSGDVHAKYMLQLLGDSLMTNIPRFPDGTFHRNTTMWTDDMYMCLPFLSRLWAITGENQYLDEIVRQVTGFYSRMFMKEQGLYSHIFFVKEGCRNLVPWGRGNGWVLLALSEVLQIMPKEYSGYETILQIFREFAGGVLRWRDREKGIWHQVINNPDSYLETSGSAMFIRALALGVKNGWIGAEYREDVLDAWTSMTERCIDSDGNVYGICMGSGCHMEERYYLNLDTIVNDDHGVGIVLEAGAAVMEMLGE